MTTKCRIGKAWGWVVSERSPGRRLLAYVSIVAIGFLGFCNSEANDRALKRNDERQQRIAAEQEADRSARRIANAANLFNVCQQGNAAADALDEFTVTLGALATPDTATPEQRARIGAFVAELRSVVPPPLDCTVHLLPLSEQERRTVQATTVPPTVPRTATTLRQ